MEFWIISLFLLLFSLQLHTAIGRHHHDSDEDYNKGKDDPNDLSDHCIHIRMDHDTQLTDYLICPYGCCGSLDDQKCCEDPDKKKHDDEGHGHLVRGLLVFAAVMLIVALSCCVFGVYKHKKAKLRKTSPGKIYETSSTTPVQRTAPYTTVFYTSKSGLKPVTDLKKTRPTVHNTNPEKTAPVHDNPSPPPGYSENPTGEPDLPLYSDQTPPPPPPPYSFGMPSAAPISTEFR